MPKKQNPLVQPSLYTIMEASLNRMGPEPGLNAKRFYDDDAFKEASRRVDEGVKKVQMHEEMKRTARIRHRAERQGR